eukprot:jgi/Psemu1/292712/fgenesh1_pg.1243_\
MAVKTRQTKKKKPPEDTMKQTPIPRYMPPSKTPTKPKDDPQFELYEYPGTIQRELCVLQLAFPKSMDYSPALFQFKPKYPPTGLTYISLMDVIHTTTMSDTDKLAALELKPELELKPPPLPDDDQSDNHSMSTTDSIPPPAKNLATTLAEEYATVTTKSPSVDEQIAAFDKGFQQIDNEIQSITTTPEANATSIQDLINTAITKNNQDWHLKLQSLENTTKHLNDKLYSISSATDNLNTAIEKATQLEKELSTATSTSWALDVCINKATSVLSSLKNKTSTLTTRTSHDTLTKDTLHAIRKSSDNAIATLNQLSTQISQKVEQQQRQYDQWLTITTDHIDQRISDTASTHLLAVKDQLTKMIDAKLKDIDSDRDHIIQSLKDTTIVRLTQRDIDTILHTSINSHKTEAQQIKNNISQHTAKQLRRFTADTNTITSTIKTELAATRDDISLHRRVLESTIPDKVLDYINSDSANIHT